MVSARLTLRATIGQRRDRLARCPRPRATAPRTPRHRGQRMRFAPDSSRGAANSRRASRVIRAAAADPKLTRSSSGLQNRAALIQRGDQARHIPARGPEGIANGRFGSDSVIVGLRMHVRFTFKSGSLAQHPKCLRGANIGLRPFPPDGKFAAKNSSANRGPVR